jgi:hypothetical protein
VSERCQPLGERSIIERLPAADSSLRLAKKILVCAARIESRRSLSRPTHSFSTFPTKNNASISF